MYSANQFPGTRQRLLTSHSVAPTQFSKQQQPFTVAGMQQSGKHERSANKWGWTQMDEVMVPFIFRGSEKFVSVKMVESRLLSKFPKMKQGDLSNVGPIYSYYVTDSEAKLLTEINKSCYKHGFGTKPFSTKDLIVSLDNFASFYSKAKKHFESKKAEDAAVARQLATPVGGWLQINNTVIPYLLRGGVKFIPLSVVKYGAGLLLDPRINELKSACTDSELQLLNVACRTARVNFTFSSRTKLVKLESATRMCSSTVKVIDLQHVTDPLTHAQYQYDLYPAPFPGAAQQTLPPRNPFQQTTARQSNGSSSFMQSSLQSPPQLPRLTTPASLPRGLDPAAAAAAAIVAAAGSHGESSHARRGSNSSASTGNSRPASAQSRGTPPDVDSQRRGGQNGFFIGQKFFNGRTILYVTRALPNSETLIHVEHLAREFFAHVTCDDACQTLTQIGVVLQHLERDAMSVMNQYCASKQLPALQRTEAIAYSALKQHFSQLQYIFKLDSAASSSETSSQDGEGMTSALDLSEDVSSQRRKRGRDAQGGAKKAKQICRRLEDTVQLLRSRQEPVLADVTETATGSDSAKEGCDQNPEVNPEKPNDVTKETETEEEDEDTLRIVEDVDEAEPRTLNPEQKEKTSDIDGGAGDENIATESTAAEKPQSIDASESVGSKVSADQAIIDLSELNESQENETSSSQENANEMCALTEFMQPPQEVQTEEGQTGEGQGEVEFVDATITQQTTPIEVYNDPGFPANDVTEKPGDVTEGNVSDATTTDEMASEELVDASRLPSENEQEVERADDEQKEENKSDSIDDAAAACTRPTTEVRDVSGCHDDAQGNPISPILEDPAEGVVEKDGEQHEPKEQDSTDKDQT